MVEGMSVVVNVMFSLTSVLSPTLRLERHVGTHGGEVMYFYSFFFMGELAS